MDSLARMVRGIMTTLDQVDEQHDAGAMLQ